MLRMVLSMAVHKDGAMNLILNYKMVRATGVIILTIVSLAGCMDVKSLREKEAKRALREFKYDKEHIKIQDDE
jgi:hypothetical protein